LIQSFKLLAGFEIRGWIIFIQLQKLITNTKNEVHCIQRLRRTAGTPLR